MIYRGPDGPGRRDKAGGGLRNLEIIMSASSSFIPKVLPLLDFSGLAAILGLAPKTVRNIHSASPSRLPPSILLPAGGRRWRLEDVENWIAELAAAQHPASAATPVADVEVKRRPGRPRKISSEGGKV